jgi:tetratricopeptide (TPR) repeat protein
VWDTGDRADKLVKELEASRAKLKTAPAMPAQPPTAAATAAKTGNTPPFAATLPPAAAPTTVPAGGAVAAQTRPTTPPGGPAAIPTSPAMLPGMAAVPASPAAPPAPVAAADPKKAAAQKLIADGKQLANSGEFAGAKAKYLEADKLGAAFAPGEPTPGFAVQELNAHGAGTMDRLVKEAEAQTAKKDYAKADACLTAAGEIAAALGLFPRPVEEAKSALRLASGGKFGGPAAAGLTPVAGPETLVPVGVGPVMPVAPAAAAAPSSTATKPAAGGVSGRQLLDQAVVEFKSGNLDMASRLAMQAHNLGARDEARGLLNSIDAEKLSQKKATAAKSFDAACAAMQQKDYGHALSVFALIDPNLLPADAKAKHADLVAACKAELDKGAVTTAAAQEPEKTPAAGEPPAANPPGAARVNDPKVGPDSPTTQVDSLRKVQFQKLRAEGLKVAADAQAAFGRGETDLAINMLVDYTNRVRASNLEPGGVALLVRPIDSRLEMFRIMKGQADAIAREKQSKKDAREQIVGRGAAEEQRKAEVQRLVRQCNALMRDGKYKEAEGLALQAKQLDPDNEAVAGLAHMAKFTGRVKEQERIKNEKEGFIYGGLSDADKVGDLVTVDDPVKFRLDRAGRARGRGTLDDVYLRTRTPAEYEIELKLDKPISIEFNEVPLSLAVDNLRKLTGLPITFDTAVLEAEGISTGKPITDTIPNVAARHILSIVLEKAGLSYVVEHDVVKVTSTKKAKGRLFTKVFSVADLVTPVPNFALPDYANLDKALNRNALNSGNLVMQGLNTPGGPLAPANGLGGGVPAGFQAGAAATMPGMSGAIQYSDRAGGTLQNTTNPLGASANLAPNMVGKQEQLVKLIQGMVRPYSWDASGGPGKLEYFDLGSALVVNQTADVIREVADLLEALRRLQDLAMAVEVRIISLSETFFERMGVDFSVNVKTNNTSFEPGLVGNVFRPEPFINDINNKGVTVGLTPAGTFTPDLDVPIRSTSFQYAIPGFGGYPNNPGNNGGVSLGLAFLNDIQVFMFMEAAQGDRRINVMQAPKLTLFNGQTATMAITETEFLVTSVTVASVNGQIVFIPQNNPLPGIGGNNAGNFSVTIQGVVSADRRFVRLNQAITLSAQTGATVPLFPITTFITPVFEGGSQGIPIPFTQFLQQPSFTTLTIATTVVCPDGGTVLMGGLKTLSEGRNEFGPPFLSKIPYLNRLFKNVGIGRETRHIMIMVTPRIIINAEEEINQTESRQLGAGGP